MDNPLLDFSGLPRFAAIRAEHVAPAIDPLIEAGRACAERLAVDELAPTWDNFIEPLDDANERLGRAWSHVGHLNAVVSTPALRDAYNTMLPKVTQYFTEQGQDQRLHARLRALHASSGFAALTPARKRVVENRLRDFRLGGAELPPPAKARFLELQEQLAKRSAKFQDNVLDATNGFGHFVTDPAELSGIPADVIATAKAAAEKEGKPGWKLTLHMPCYMPVLQYADHHALRKAMHHGFVTRGSELGKSEWDNSALVEEILALRMEAAKLLGFADFAELSLFTKMAARPAEALAFLGDLAQRSRPFAQRDMQELLEFARADLGLAELHACDVAYASEKLRQKRYAFSNQEVRQYFGEDTVLAGMFRVVETIYGVRIREARAETWHPAVRFFEVADATGGAIGHFYLDLYAREGKRGGAWMDEAIARRRLASGVQTPVATLTCNFSAPVGGKPALFTHVEVETLYHEFGHGLHQLLTQVDEIGVSGISGVEWDAVELPSQIMENFCWEWDVVQDMSRHVDTGEALPRPLFERMLAAKNFQSGMQCVRQIEYATFDMRLHAGVGGTWRELLSEVRREVAVVSHPPYDRFPMQFSHIFGGGYAAGYYSYKWAEVLSADAFSAFEERGVLSAEVGDRFRREVLAAGGSRPAIESFVAFRGRKPQIDALLRHNGMTATA